MLTKKKRTLSESKLDQEDEDAHVGFDFIRGSCEFALSSFCRRLDEDIAHNHESEDDDDSENSNSDEDDAINRFNHDEYCDENDQFSNSIPSQNTPPKKVSSTSTLTRPKRLVAKRTLNADRLDELDAFKNMLISSYCDRCGENTSDWSCQECCCVICQDCQSKERGLEERLFQYENRDQARMMLDNVNDEDFDSRRDDIRQFCCAPCMYKLVTY